MTPERLFAIARWQRWAGCSGLAALLICLLSALVDRAQLFRSYWFAWVFWSGLGFGSLAILLLQFLTGGLWGRVVQGPAISAVRTLPLMVLLFLPVLLGMKEIFAWARPEYFEGHHWPNKAAYLSVPWFIVRAAVYFAVLIVLGLLIGRKAPPSVARSRISLGTLSGPGLVGYVLCMNFAATDWVMSLEAQWYSTMLAVIFMVGQFLSALALCIVVVTTLASDESLSPVSATKLFHDLGNLLLAFAVFWAYVSFSQFLIIWSGNLPREVSWYLSRRSGGWQTVALVFIFFQFAVPFALLLSRAVKRHRRRLRPIAALVLVSHAVAVFWLIAPAFLPNRLQIHWLDLAAFIGIGGVWLAAYLGFLRQSPPQFAWEEEGHD